MLESIPSELKSDAIRLLQLLVHSERPLRLAEAREIIATEIEGESTGFDIKRRLFRESDVLDYCPSLVVVVHAADDELHLSHFSVKEYLLTNDQLKFPTASISITRTCLRYLTDIDGSHAKMKQNFPMARFAAEVWVGFAASAEEVRDAALAEAIREVLEASVTFIEEEVTFQRWCRLYQQDREWSDDPGPPGGSRLYYACLGGLCETARRLLEKGADVNAKGGEYGNALCAASSGGYKEIAEMLLERGADVNAKVRRDGNALQAAASGGHKEVVQMLLEKGAEVNAKGGYYGNALCAASSKGHKEVVQMLLEYGAEPRK